MTCTLCGSELHNAADCPMRPKPEDGYMLWYLLQTASRKEDTAIDGLIQRDINYLCPEIDIKTRTGVKNQKMYPGYVFVEMDKDNGPFHLIDEIKGSFGLVKFSLYPHAVEHHVIQRIKALSAYFTKLAQADYFKTGDVIRITDGPFKDFNAIYRFKTGKDRSRIMVSLFGQLRPMDIEHTAIEKVSN